MTELDIRSLARDKITKIRVSGYSDAYYTVETISNLGDSVAELEASDEPTTLKIVGKEHAENLIKGLEKAIELGWFE